MTTSEQAIVAVVEKYQGAANSRDPSKFREILALGDARFTEIEDHIPVPFGFETANDILRWIEEHPASRYQVRYFNTQAFLLAETVAYAVAMHEWQSAPWSPLPGGTGPSER